MATVYIAEISLKKEVVTRPVFAPDKDTARLAVEKTYELEDILNLKIFEPISWTILDDNTKG